MGVLSTYGELKTGITDYTGRGGNATFTANLPLFVLRAHNVLMRDLRIPLLQVSSDVTIDAERVALPEGFRAVTRLFIDSDYDAPLSPTSVENRVRLAANACAGRPTAFAIEGGYFAFAPRPDATYTGKLLAYVALDFFADDDATNALLTKHPFAYFYGALAEAARFDKNDEDTALYESLFRDEVANIETAERRDALMGGVLMPVPSTTVTP
jgi:hypothetical protein